VPSVPSQAIARAVRTSASQQGFRLNSAQERSLILLSERVTQGPGDGGVYLWGPAGRGKTWLVDAVLDAAQAADLENVVRVHLNELFVRLHNVVGLHQDRAGSFDLALDDLLAGCQLLVLDELYVHDSDDAWMAESILRRLLNNGGSLIATSNYDIDHLLPHPRFHHHASGLIKLLRFHVTTVHFDGETDHRTSVQAGKDKPGFSSGTWLSPGTPAQLVAVGLTPPTPAARESIEVSRRPLSVLSASKSVLQVGFGSLCEGLTAPQDYLELISRFPIWVLHGVPSMRDCSADARQRLVNVVDLLHDHDVRLVVLADHLLTETFEVDHLPIDAQRTRSRLELLGQRRASHPDRLHRPRLHTNAESGAEVGPT